MLLVSALLSIWILANARKHFSFLVALLWALATFFLTPIVLPIYLIVLLLRRGSALRNEARWQLTVPLIYGVVIIAGITVYLANERKGVDAHLARAAYAKLRGNHSEAIAEYRAALLEKDDPHTRKLLGLELIESDQWTEALGELRKAEAEGEPDDLVIFKIASLLDLLKLPGQAQLEYKRFLESGLCLQPLPDKRCETARSRIQGP
jgi:tetratricopeptide (TPR) repeat protein